jgi:hypothetical protein
MAAGARNTNFTSNLSLITNRANSKLMKPLDTFMNSNNYKNFSDPRVVKVKDFLSKNNLRIKIRGMDGYFGDDTKLSGVERINKQSKGYILKPEIEIVKKYAASQGVSLKSFAGFMDFANSDITLPPAVKQATNKILQVGGKVLRGAGKAAIVLDPMFAAYDFSTAIDQGAGGKNASEYMVKRFGEGILNLPDLVASGGKFVKDKLQGKDAKFEQGTLYEPFDFAQRGLEENLTAMPQSQKVRNIANRDFDVGIGASMGMVDDDQVPASRQEIEEARQKYLESQMGPYYKYGIESLPRKVAKPTKYDIRAKKVYNN